MRKTPCDFCGCCTVLIDNSVISEPNGFMQMEYKEICANCDCLLYGFVRQIKEWEKLVL